VGGPFNNINDKIIAVATEEVQLMLRGYIMGILKAHALSAAEEPAKRAKISYFKGENAVLSQPLIGG